MSAKHGRTAFAALLLAAVLGAAPAIAADLRIGLQEDPDMLDPHEARTFVGRIVFNALCDKLVDSNDKLEIVPRIATSWNFSADGKTLTMKIREGVKFHDGTTLDAAAVKANIDRARTLATSLRKSELGSVAKVEAPDPTTVVFTLNAPDAPLLAQLSDRAGMLLSPASFDKPVAPNPVCSGPYKFVERVQNDRIVLTRFKDYYDADKYTVDNVTFRIIPDSTVRLANLRSGQLDMIERLAPSDIKAAKADPKLNVVSIAGLGYQGITINLGNGERAKTPLGMDKRVRQAFSLSLDRDAINQVVFEGVMAPSAQPFPPASPYHDKNFPTPKRDVAKAKELLKAAGAEKVSFEMLVANSTQEQQLAQVIQAMASEVGIDVKIKSTEFATIFKVQMAGDFQSTLLQWSGRVDPDGNVHQFMTTGGSVNDPKFSNAEVDKALNTARGVYDVAERQKLYAAAEKITREELPIIYLFHRAWTWAIDKKVTGFEPNPDGMIRLAGVKVN
ncbi:MULTISPECIES: ABC transporter substrate-binding protein [Rhodomicrobium]|uniref:ABC transporter substrate-binding protein n=1 Tax=Rhodomicrobium TaxID=1068 RepID=UPI000B4B4DF0|nr:MULTISPECIES: ABC transporter substrate-binding protein [Rhodomicrobium]